MDGVTGTLAQTDRLVRAGQTTEALKELRQATKLHPREIEVRLRYGRLLEREGDAGKAHRRFAKVVQCAPERRDGCEAAARTALASGRAKEGH